ncbi:MAG: GTPase ObgE, partial [Nitrospirota bacterium]
MFIDEVKIFVKAGDGGNGCVSFMREKYVPRGRPNGGDGGNGGDITIRTSSSVSTLLDLKYQQHYMAKRGGHGK